MQVEDRRVMESLENFWKASLKDPRRFARVLVKYAQDNEAYPEPAALLYMIGMFHGFFLYRGVPEELFVESFRRTYGDCKTRPQDVIGPLRRHFKTGNYQPPETG